MFIPDAGQSAGITHVLESLDKRYMPLGHPHPTTHTLMQGRGPSPQTGSHAELHWLKTRSPGHCGSIWDIKNK